VKLSAHGLTFIIWELGIFKSCHWSYRSGNWI